MGTDHTALWRQSLQQPWERALFSELPTPPAPRAFAQAGPSLRLEGAGMQCQPPSPSLLFPNRQFKPSFFRNASLRARGTRCVSFAAHAT